MYQVGDVVVHPMHGSGTICAITTERVDGQQQEYYVFSIPSGTLELHIPVTNAQNIGVRDMVSSEQAESLLHSFGVFERERITNWSKRYRDNLERLKSGDLTQVVAVLKDLLLREYRQGLSTGERKMLYTAKQIFISEIAAVTGLAYCEVEKTICQSVKAASKEK